jgi:tetratricopeptide (TPR) repeat protein
VTETRQAFADEIDAFGPAAFHTLALALCEQKHPQPLDVVLAVLKLSAHDAEVLYSYREALVQAARTATPAQKDDLRRALSLVWEGCYPLEKDVAFELARIAFAMSAAEDALRYSEESLRVYGETAPSRLMEAYSLAMLGRPDGALRSAERALALDPGFAPAAELLERLRGARPRGTRG